MKILQLEPRRKCSKHFVQMRSPNDAMMSMMSYLKSLNLTLSRCVKGMRQKIVSRPLRCQQGEQFGDVCWAPLGMNVIAKDDVLLRVDEHVGCKGRGWKGDHTMGMPQHGYVNTAVARTRAGQQVSRSAGSALPCDRRGSCMALKRR